MIHLLQTFEDAGGEGDTFGHNQGGDDQFIWSSGSWTIRGAAAANGDFGLRHAPTSGFSEMRWMPDSGNGRRVVIRRSVRFATLPSAGMTLAQLASTQETMAGLRLHESGSLHVYADGSPNRANGYTIAAGTLYWAEMAAVAGTTASNGWVELKVFAADGTTELHHWKSPETFNTGTAEVSDVRFGGATVATEPVVDDMDDLQVLVTTDMDAWIGPIGGAPDPVTLTLTPIADQEARAGSTVELSTTLSPATPGATYAWRRISGDVITLEGSGAARTFRAPATDPPAGGSVVVGCTASSGGDSSPEVTATITLLPEADWSRVPGGTWQPASGV